MTHGDGRVKIHKATNKNNRGRNVKKIRIITLATIALFVSACSNFDEKPPSAAETAYAARSVQRLNNAPMMGATNANTQTGTYPIVTNSDLIAPEDTLDVNVFKVPDLSAKSLKVEPTGKISLPLIGSVKVTGLSITQAEQKITQRLKQFMQDPKVSVTRTDKAVTKRVTVEGEVKTPGVFPIKGNLSFLQAIAMAQGLTPLGDARSVLFYRDGRQHPINLGLVRTGQIPDPVLRGDDRIVVLKDPTKVREKKVMEYLPIITGPLSLIPGI